MNRFLWRLKSFLFNGVKSRRVAKFIKSFCVWGPYAFFLLRTTYWMSSSNWLAIWITGCSLTLEFCQGKFGKSDLFKVISTFFSLCNIFLVCNLRNNREYHQTFFFFFAFSEHFTEYLHWNYVVLFEVLTFCGSMNSHRNKMPVAMRDIVNTGLYAFNNCIAENKFKTYCWRRCTTEYLTAKSGQEFLLRAEN